MSKTFHNSGPSRISPIPRSGHSVRTSGVALGDLVLSVSQHRITLKANTSGACWGLCVVLVERPAGIVYTAEFTRIPSHYEQESGKIRPAPL